MKTMKSLGISKSKGDFRPTQGYEASRLGGSTSKSGTYEIGFYNYNEQDKIKNAQNVANKLRQKGLNARMFGRGVVYVDY